jgi:hypothetical protein
MRAPDVVGGGMAVDDGGAGRRSGRGWSRLARGYILVLPLLHRSSGETTLSLLLGGVPS